MRHDGEMQPPREKNPAAVELGRRRQAQMTAEERAAFAAARDFANAKRTPLERREIARKAAMTRRQRPKWMAPSNPVEKCVAPAATADAAGTSGELTHLDRAIDDIPDDLLEQLASALFRRQA